MNLISYVLENINLDIYKLDLERERIRAETVTHTCIGLVLPIPVS